MDKAKTAYNGLSLMSSEPGRVTQLDGSAKSDGRAGLVACLARTICNLNKAQLECVKGKNMLNGIPKNVSPDLLKVLMEMGHGDEIILSDGNYPATSSGNTLVRCIGLGVPELLESILTLMPLDDYVESPVAMMESPTPEEPPIWATYREIIAKHCGEVKISHIEHDAFIERARKCYAIVATSEEATYANILLRKGVVQ